MKIIQKNGALTIDRQEIDKLLAAKNFIGLNRSPRAERVIVSLTSYKPRINDVKYAIYSLLNQTFPPDKLILWLDEDSFPHREKDLPSDLLELREFGLTIDWCDNLRPYKKLIPALEQYPDDIIVTADDDIFYRPDWLKILYDEHLREPDCVVAHRAHRIRLNAQGNFYPYVRWQSAIKNLNASPRYSNFATGAGGILYAKKFFHADILNRELFNALAKTNDDVWFWAMAVLNGTKIFVPPAAQRNLIYVNIDAQKSGETLWSVNKTQNDVYVKRVVEKYPSLLDKLIRETAEFKTYISVVLPVKNPANISASLENIFQQKFPDFELILINLGSRVQIPQIPTNFRIINYPGGTLADALNLGLQRASGDYVLFKDENSLLPTESLEILAKAADNSKADVLHFAGHIKLADRAPVSDDSPELKRDTPTFLDAPKQMRAAFWLQGKLSRRLDTKIFKREFLLKHGITFDDDLVEFMFKALVYADKYLLVPGAFCFCK